MEQLIKILEPFLLPEEVISIQNLSLATYNDEEASKHFTPKRAKQIANILFANRCELKTNEYAINLFSYCSIYYEEKTPLNLILREGALVPEGMCELKSNGPFLYESIY